MKIKFQSHTLQNGKENNIEFTSNGEFIFENGFDIITFTEPTYNISNRIEISSKRINIFAGPTTLYLILDKNQSALNLFEKHVGTGSVKTGTNQEFEVFTQILDHQFKTGKQYFFSYELFQKVNSEKNVIGKFDITLTLE
ncbi:DUF1934 family protein [Mycoplasmopsis cricetuli]|uniref:DUF1934 family protein n=1 Tax=Mycoplasmopsis cricetuli TaxID=171283 RepID=UPI00046FD4CF|nr:DUF1934 family protein [Mycoplasmopsis cricetuli]